MRFDFVTLEFCRLFGESTADPSYKRDYFGLACTSVELIRTLNGYGLKYTPDAKSNPPNLFHCDIYDYLASQVNKGVAMPPNLNHRINEFKKLWRPHEHTNTLTKDLVQPPA
jgi:hypothetical protein